MDKFFESYRNKAEADPDLTFKESDWNLLEKKMDLKKHIPIPFIFWSFLTGLSVAAVLFLLFGKKSPAVRRAPVIIPEVIQHSTIKTTHDTIYIDKPVYLTKVVTKYFNSTSELALESTQSNATSLSVLPAEIKALTLKNLSLQNRIDQQTDQIETLKTSLSKITDQATLTGGSEDNHEQAAPEKISETADHALKYPSAKELEVPIAVSLPLVNDTLGTWSKFVQFVKPVGLEWGLHGGVPLLLNQRLKNRPGYLVSTKVSLLTRGGLELQAGLTVAKLYYESSVMDIRLGVPVQNAPKNDFSFYKAEAVLPSISFDLALLYTLTHHKRLSPKVGLGIGYLMPLTSNVGYDFVSINSPEEYPVDFKYKPKATNPYSLQWHGVMSYALTPRWTLAGQATLHQGLRKDDFLSSRIDLGAGLRYRLY